MVGYVRIPNVTKLSFYLMPSISSSLKRRRLQDKHKDLFILYGGIKLIINMRKKLSRLFVVGRVFYVELSLVDLYPGTEDEDIYEY